MSWKEANRRGGGGGGGGGGGEVGDFVKVETKRLFQSSWLRDFSCSKFDKDLTGAYDS